MKNNIADSLCADAVWVGTGRVFRNLALFPLRLAPGVEMPRPLYLTLDEALTEKTVEITEVSADGSVPELRLRNTGNRPVLLLDGEELIGAKQNRTVNMTTMVAGKSEILLPVTCVEAGRWRDDSVLFQSSRQAHFAEGRAAKQADVSERLFLRRAPNPDQGDVWNRISEKASRLRVPSPTAAMTDVFAAHSGTVEEYVAALMADVSSNEVGGVFVLNGRVFGIERFDAVQTWHKLLPKIIRSFALDAVDKQSEPTKPLDPDAVAAFVARIAVAPVETYPALGIGENLRLREPGLTGAALSTDGMVTHLSAFLLPVSETTPTEAAPTVQTANRARASERMRR